MPKFIHELLLDVFVVVSGVVLRLGMLTALRLGMLTALRLGMLTVLRLGMLTALRLGMLTALRLGMLTALRLGMLAVLRLGMLTALRLGLLAVSWLGRFLLLRFSRLRGPPGPDPRAARPHGSCQNRRSGAVTVGLLYSVILAPAVRDNTTMCVRYVIRVHVLLYRLKASAVFKPDAQHG